MKESTEDIILIERYLEGAMEEADKKAFEDRLSKDSDFNTLLDEYAVLIAGVKFAARDKMHTQFKNIEKEIAEETKVVQLKPSTNRLFYYAAASIVLLFTVFYVIRSTIQPSPVELANEYFMPYPATVGAISRSDEKSNDLTSKAMSMYESGDYSESIVLLKELASMDNNEINQFYLANAFQAHGQSDQAQSIYQSILATGEIFKEQATWNLALCYLDQGDKNKAVQLLQDTDFKIQSYKKMSDELLDKL